MSAEKISLTLHIWRQTGQSDKGRFETHHVQDVSTDASFLEMLDQLNESLVEQGKDFVMFESDCREGICGTCGFVINGQAHGPDKGTTVCQLHMRTFKNGDELWLEPWRARAFPVVKDLMVKRDAFDRIQAKGGYNSINCGNAPDGNALLVGRERSSEAFDSAMCIGCGACVAACKNASAMLFVGAKISHLALLPQGEPEREQRALDMVAQMDEEGFGACTNTLDCQAACPKEISVSNIQRMNREFLGASLFQND